jgi:hypothetical protein
LALGVFICRGSLLKEVGGDFNDVAFDSKTLINEAFVCHLFKERSDEIDVSVNHDKMFNITVNFFSLDFI